MVEMEKKNQQEHQSVEEKNPVTQQEYQQIVEVGKSVVQVQDDLQWIHPEQVQEQKVGLHEQEHVDL